MCKFSTETFAKTSNYFVSEHSKHFFNFRKIVFLAILQLSIEYALKYTVNKY